ncbi:uncharacterized protein LOC144799562 [Lissotriton helveticus]
MDAYHARLRELASTCTEDDQTKEVTAQLIQGCRNKTLILRQPRISLEEILILAHSHKLSDIRATAMETALHPHAEQTANVKMERVDALRTLSRGGRGRWPIRTARLSQCGYCGREEHPPDSCPARGKTCSKCGIPNHFVSVCRGGSQGRGNPGRRMLTGAVRNLSLKESTTSRSARPPAHHSQHLDDSSTEEDEECYFVSFAGDLKKRRCPQPKCNIEIDGAPVTGLIDTGATFNVMGSQHYKKLNTRPQLTPSKIRIPMYGSQKPLPLKGKMTVQVKSETQAVTMTFHVVDREADILVRSHTAEDLNLIAFANAIKVLQTDDILDLFPQLFKGFGKIKRPPVQLHIDKAVKPVALRHLRIPFNL